MERTTTWSKIGTDVTKSATIDEVLEAAKLNYTVKKTPVFVDVMGQKLQVPNKVATVRDDTNHIYGVVGENYKVCNNAEAFDFINCIKNDMKFVKAGETASGLVYVIAELPETVVLGDTVAPHVIFQNGHNGTISLKAALCMLRIVCQNQFNYSFKHNANTISIRHSGDMNVKLEAARQTIASMYEYIQSYEDLAQQLSTTRVNDATIQKILNTLIGDESASESGREADRIIQRKEMFTSAYKGDDNQNFIGTAWGVVNAYTDYLTHKPAARATQTYNEKHFIRTSVDKNTTEQLVNMLVA